MPYLLSDVYVIDNTEKVINFAGVVTPRKFLSNLIVSPGATASIVNKKLEPRTDGFMKYDDRVKVTKGDVVNVLLH